METELFMAWPLVCPGLCIPYLLRPGIVFQFDTIKSVGGFSLRCELSPPEYVGWVHWTILILDWQPHSPALIVYGRYSHNYHGHNPTWEWSPVHQGTYGLLPSMKKITRPAANGVKPCPDLHKVLFWGDFRDSIDILFTLGFFGTGTWIWTSVWQFKLLNKCGFMMSLTLLLWLNYFALLCS